MKTIIALPFLLILSLLWFSSCEEDNSDVQKPEVANFEVGYNDTIYIGGDVHIEFEVSDNDRLDYYQVKIHPEGEHHDDDLSKEGDEWEVDTTFTEINGLRNFEVHNHEIKIPETAHAGEYHFDLEIVDMAGNSLSLEQDLYLAEGEGEHDDHDHHDEHD